LTKTKNVYKSHNFFPYFQKSVEELPVDKINSLDCALPKINSAITAICLMGFIKKIYMLEE